MAVFKGIWSDFWGPRLEYILYATVAALLDCENVSLLGVQRMLSDAKYRRWVVKQVKDPVVRVFWTTEFENYDRKFLLEAIAPIQNKVGQLLMSPHVRNILGQVRSRIDARFMMDNGRIFIANLSKGALGADKANLLGALWVTQFQLAAMSRVDTPEADRRDFHLYVDEFHSFASDSFASILSEARKYRLCLTLSHQYVAQLVEGFPSVWWLTQNGFGRVVGLMGSECSEEQAKLIVSLQTPDSPIWFMPDGDEAGERLAVSLLGQISPHRYVRWVKLTEKKQPTDFSAHELKSRLTE